MSDDDMLRRLYQRQQVADKEVAREHEWRQEVAFQQTIKKRLTLEFRNAVHLAISGASARFEVKGTSFTIGCTSFALNNLADGTFSYTCRRFFLTTPDGQVDLGEYENGLQAAIVRYLGGHGYI